MCELKVILIFNLLLEIFPIFLTLDSPLFARFLCCREPIMTCCPVCGESLDVSYNLNNIIHLTLCFDEGTGNQVMTGGFLTDSQAAYGWDMLRHEGKRTYSCFQYDCYEWNKSPNWMLQSNFICRWIFKLSEWAHYSSYDVGLKSGSSASHILVCTSRFDFLL